MKRNDPVMGCLQGRQLAGLARRPRGGDFFGTDPQPVRRQTEAIEPLGICQQRRIATGANIGKYVSNGVADIGLCLPLFGKQVDELAFEIGRGRIEPTRHRDRPASPR